MKHCCISSPSQLLNISIHFRAIESGGVQADFLRGGKGVVEEGGGVVRTGLLKFPNDENCDY